MSNSEGTLALTERGRLFVDQEGGPTEALLDEQEGLLHILALVADLGPTRPAGLLQDWTDYLNQYSRFSTPSTRTDTLRRRLNNLLRRALVSRDRARYSVTATGATYLSQQRSSVDGQQELRTLVKKQKALVHDNLRNLLLEMRPIAFEHLVKRLLEAMDYEDVEVTSPSSDGGVDVVARIELGITSAREVVQAKRHARPIQRRDLDALRGSLHRFNAVRGTIIATSRFARGTEKAALEPGVAPITLIDRDALIDLLTKHEIGVRKRQIETWTVDEDLFADLNQKARLCQTHRLTAGSS